jgi:hypothetical protein
MTRHAEGKKDFLIGRPGETHPDWTLNPEKLLLGLEGEEENREIVLARRHRAYKALLKLCDPTDSEKLTVHEFSVFFMHKVMEIPYDNIVESTGASEGSLRTTCSRAKDKIKELRRQQRD